MEKRFLSIADVQGFLGVSRQTVYRLLAQGMPCYRLGGRRVFDENELIEWVKSHRNDKPKKPARAKSKKRGGKKV